MDTYEFFSALIDHLLGGASKPPAVPVAAPPASPAAEDVATRAAEFVEPFEGFRSAPYQDSVGVWTIGYGSTRDHNGRPVTAATPAVSAAEAQALVARDLEYAIADVHKAVTVPLSDAQTVALASFVYNLGGGALRSSTLLRMLNAKDYDGAADQFALWDHAGGRVLAALLRRREAEAALFRNG